MNDLICDTSGLLSLIDRSDPMRDVGAGGDGTARSSLPRLVEPGQS